MNRRIERFWAVSIPAAILLLFAGLLYTSSVPTPIISVDSGFYGEEFMVTVEVPRGCTAYYTTDGTEPDENSEIYSSGILIYNRTPEDAQLANINGVSGQTLWIGGGDIFQPSSPIPKATVLTVKIQDQHGRWSDPIQNFYYVGEDYRKYQDITVVSLAVSPEDLFGENGIYINGDEYNSYVALNGLSGLETSLALEDIWGLANWWKTGDDYRKETFISILKDGQVFQSDAKINIAGHTSRIYSQKAFTVRYDTTNDRPILDKDHSLGYAIWESSSYKLRNGGTQNHDNFLNDYICQALSSELAFDTQSQQLCVLFINGEYWGIYELTERYNDDYFYLHYGLRKQNKPAVIKSGLYLDMGREDAKANYDSLVDWIKETDFTREEAYEELCTKVDIASLVQLYAANIYLANNDFVNNNIACWSYLDSENSQYAKWKWMMYDCDTTFNDIDITSMLDLYLRDDLLFEKLCQNNQFCYELAKTIRYLQDIVFDLETVESLLDEMINELMPFIEDHYNRIGPESVAALDSSQKRNHFRDYGERVKEFFINRSNENTTSIEAYLAAARYFPVEIVQLSGENWNADQYITSGISSNEIKYTWTNDNEVLFKSLYFGDGTADVKCRMKVFIQATHGEQQISVIVNNQEVYCGNISGETVLSIPFSTDKNGRADISLYLPNAISPFDLGTSMDKRMLSLSLSSIIFEQNSPSSPNYTLGEQTR